MPRITLLSAAERRYCEPLLAGFAAARPGIEVDFVFGISTALHKDYLAGAPADLIWSSAMDLQMALVLDGHARPHGLAPALPPGALHRDLALSTTSEPLATLLRAPLGGPAQPAGTPAEIAALLRAEPARFRHRVVLPDIEANGLGFLAMLQWSLESPDFSGMLDALSEAEPRTVGSAAAPVSAMGDNALGLHVLGAYAKRAVAADPALSIATSTAPPQAVARIAFIPTRARETDAARAFLAYLVSPEGQAALDAAGLFPITTQRVQPIPIDRGFAALLDEAARGHLLARWRAATSKGENQ